LQNFAEKAGWVNPVKGGVGFGGVGERERREGGDGGGGFALRTIFKVLTIM
jgi:hypothetical protein